jgi:hypothetical protein
MSTRFARLLFACIALLVMAFPASAPAAKKTKTLTLPGEMVFHHGARDDLPGNCSATPFIQWPDEERTLSATVFWTTPREEMSLTKEPPFDNVYNWVITYISPPGMSWIALGSGSVAGAKPIDCGEMSDKQKLVNNAPYRVELTIDVTRACKKILASLKREKKSLPIIRKRLKDLNPKAKGPRRKLKEREGRVEKKIQELTERKAAEGC